MAREPLPRLRWLGPLWLAVYLPSYTLAYGALNFLFLCNVGVVLTALGLWRRSSLLLSSQALAAMLVCLFWTADAGGRLLLGHNPLGLTAYMWDPQYPLFTRLLSLYHVAWPFVLVAALRRVGYDRRALALQSALAALAIVASRLTEPALNINYAHRDPFFRIAFEPAPLHLAITLGAVVVVAYVPTHLLLLRTLPSAPPAR